MRYLLDTHIFIWWMEEKRLSKTLMDLLGDPRNKIYLSVAAIWEIVIKHSKGKLKISKDIEKGVKNSGFIVLPIETLHVLETGKFPNYHNDPFDRILIAQAKVENLTLITSDKKIWKYKLSFLKA